LTDELCRLLKKFQEDGIAVLPYKGPALALQVYHDIALRSFNDLDILVCPSDVARSKDLLIRASYQPRLQLKAQHEKALFRSECDQSFVSDDGRILVELHWAVTPPFFSFPLKVESLLQRVEKMMLVADVECTVPSTEDLLLLLCANGTKDMWERLELICAVAELVRRHPNLKWEQVLKQATDLKSERMLLLGISLAHDLFGVSLPEAIWKKIECDAFVKRLNAKVCEKLFQGDEKRVGVVEKNLFRLKAREHWRDKVRYCFLRAVTPTYKDWEMISLPQAFFFTYYFLRPFRLGKEFVVSFLRPERWHEQHQTEN
jgi:hypothetical protein